MILTVLMSVYNGEKYLKESIESILNQTYKDFEFIIINDGSMDNSLNIIQEYTKIDERIKLIDNIENKGLIYSLNKGIEEAKGKYIARMDADDIALPERLKKQVEFMECNEDLAMSGTEAYFFLDDIRFIKKRSNALTDQEKIKARLVFASCFIHPTVIMRKDILINNNLKYREEYKHAEDYGLWCEIASKYRVSNLREPLLKYRVIKTSVTRQANKDIEQRSRIFKNIYKDYLRKLGYNTSKEELDLHFQIAMIQNLNKSKYKLYEKENYLKKLSLNINNKDIKSQCAIQYAKCCAYEASYEEYCNSYFFNNDLSKIEFIKIKVIEFIKIQIKKSIMKKI